MKLNTKRTFFIGLAFLSISAFWQLYDNIIPIMLSKTFGLGETLTGAIMAIDNVLALFLLPLVGAFSDKVNTRLGKRTPFILFGTIFAVIFMTLLPLANSNKNFPLFFISLGLVLIAMASYRSPAVALMPDLTPKPLRSKANAIINLMGTLGAIYTLLTIRFLVSKVEHPNYTPVFLSISLVMVGAVILLLFTTKENKLPKYTEMDEEENVAEKNSTENSIQLSKEVQTSLILLLSSVFLWFTAYNAVTTAFSRYALEVWDLGGGSFATPLLVATGAATVAYIPIGYISSRFGRKKVIIGGIIMMTVSYFAGFLCTEYTPLIYLILALTGIGWASISVNSYPMVVEMSKGSDVGKYTGFYYTFSMLAQTITPILSGLLLEKVSYRTLFPYAMVFSILSLCTMLFVKHGDAKPFQKQNALEHFDVED